MKFKSDAVLSAKSLRYFLQLIDNMSYTQASQILGITQPALTQQIKKIERAVGAPLFGQIGKKLYLTDAGIKMQETAKELFNTVNNAVDQIQKDTNSETGDISIGMLSSIEYQVIEDFIIEFNDLFPDVTISLNMLTRNEIWERLENNHIDLAIMHLPNESIKNWKPYKVKQIYMDEVLYLTHDDVPKNKKSISLEDANRNPWVSYPVEFGVPQILTQVFKDNRVDLPESNARFTSPYQLIRFAEKTQSDTALTESFYRAHKDKIDLTPLHFDPRVSFDMSFIYRREKENIPRINNFFEHWDKFLAKEDYSSRLEHVETI